MANRCFSVVIPLYNKEREIAAALRSVAAQTVAPAEVIVVDDGSTDRSVEMVRHFEDLPLRLVSQSNAGVAAARNRGIAEARCEWIALLDADDSWKPCFLEEISSLIDEEPDCGLYCTAFEISTHNGTTGSNSPTRRGVVDDFWTEAMHHRICNSSNSVIPRRVFEALGGFPEGMRLGEDQYMWIKIATASKICFSPKCCATVSVAASNRSEKIYRPETTDHSFEELYEPEGDAARNEFVARCAIGKAIAVAAAGDTAFGRRTALFFAYTRLCRRSLCRLRAICLLPKTIRRPFNLFYKRLAWAIVRRGE